MRLCSKSLRLSVGEQGALALPSSFCQVLESMRRSLLIHIFEAAGFATPITMVFPATPNHLSDNSHSSLPFCIFPDAKYLYSCLYMYNLFGFPLDITVIFPGIDHRHPCFLREWTPEPHVDQLSQHHKAGKPCTSARCLFSATRIKCWLADP